MCAAAATSEFKRASASARFISRLRWACALITITPVRDTRWSPQRNRRSLRLSGSDERRMSKRRCTAFDTLLTFCPPAPCARTAVSSTSDSGIGATLLLMACRLPDRLAPVVFGKRFASAAAGGGIARILNLAGGPVAVGARPLGREIARAGRAVLARLALRAVFAGGAAQVARRGRGRLVRLHLLRRGRQRRGEGNDHEQ